MASLSDRIRCLGCDRDFDPRGIYQHQRRLGHEGREVMVGVASAAPAPALRMQVTILAYLVEDEQGNRWLMEAYDG